MASESNVKLMIALKEPDLDPEDLEKQTRHLVQELKEDFNFSLLV
jgi:hypothetical protein